MQLIERFKTLEGSIKAVLALIALLPSLATMTGIVPVPDQISTLVTFLFGFLGLGVILLVAIFSDTIAAMKVKPLALAICALLLSGSVASIGYLVFAQRHVVEVTEGDEEIQYLKPMTPSAKLAELVGPGAFDGDWVEALNSSSKREQIKRMMRDESAMTGALMIALLLVAQVFLVGGVTLAAWRATANEEPRAAQT